MRHAAFDRVRWRARRLRPPPNTAPSPRVPPPRTSPIDRSPHIEDAAAALVCLALTSLGLVLGRAHGVPGYGVETDFAGAFSVQADNILHGRPYTYPYHPLGYSALLALLAPGAGGSFAAGKLISALAAGLFGASTYLLVRRLAGRPVALATTGLLAAVLIPYSYLAASDLPGAAVAQLALLVLLTGRTPGPGRLLAVGVIAGLAYLIRTTGVLPLAAAAAAVFVLDAAPGRPTRPRLLLALAAGFAIGVLPSLLYNWATLGRPFGASAYVQVGLSYRPPASEAVAKSESAIVGLGSVLRVLGDHPVNFLIRYARGLVVEDGPLVATEGLGFPQFLFVGAGLVLLARRASARGWVYVGYCVLGYCVVGLVDPIIRYYLFLLPILCFAAAVGVFAASGASAGGPTGRRPTRRQALAAWALVLGLIALTVPTSMGRVRRALANDPDDLRPIATRLRHLALPGELVLARKPHLAYLAGLGGIPIVGDETLEEALERGRARGARYVVYTPEEARRWSPLRALASPSTAPPSLRPVLADPATHATIYRLVP